MTPIEEKPDSPMYAYQSNYWTPQQGVDRSVAVCRIPRCNYLLSVPDDEGSHRNQPPPIPGFPFPLTTRHIVIWHQKDCAACQASKPVFAGLREAGRAARPPFGVTEMEITPALLARFPHVTSVPLYDVVDPDPAVTASPYGPGIRLTTVRNDVNALREVVPSFVPVNPQ